MCDLKIYVTEAYSDSFVVLYLIESHTAPMIIKMVEEETLVDTSHTDLESA